MSVSNYNIPTGDAGARETVNHIRSLINQGRKNLRVRTLAENIIDRFGVDSRDPEKIVDALFQWTRHNVRYVPDPVDVEFIRSAPNILSAGFGDCDDFTVLLGSLAESIGVPVGIKIIERAGKNRYHHVYPVALMRTRQLAMDATMPHAIGYETPQIKRSEIFKESKNMSGMSGVYDSLFGRLGAEPTLTIKRHPYARNDWESRMLYRLDGRTKPPLTDAEKIQACRYAENHRYLYEYAPFSEMCKLVARPAGDYKPKGKVVPAGVFTVGEIPSLTKLDKYGVRNWIWPGISESPDPLNFQARLIPAYIYPVIGQPGYDDVTFVWRQIPLAEIPDEPPPPPPIGFEPLEPPTPYQPPELEEPIEPPTPFQPPTTEECPPVSLQPGQMLLSKGLFNEGQILNTLWGTKFAKTNPPGKTDQPLGPDQAWALYIESIEPYCNTRAIYTARYKLVTVEPELRPEIFEPRITPPDVELPPGEEPPDWETLVSEFFRLREAPPGVTEPSLPGAAPSIPVWVYVVGGVALYSLLKRK